MELPTHLFEPSKLKNDWCRPRGLFRRSKMCYEYCRPRSVPTMLQLLQDRICICNPRLFEQFVGFIVSLSFAIISSLFLFFFTCSLPLSSHSHFRSLNSPPPPTVLRLSVTHCRPLSLVFFALSPRTPLSIKVGFRRLNFISKHDLRK